jgi:uncharacterized protein YegJ (DUF2314 family)
MELVNVREMAINYPETFEVPTNEELDKIKIGDDVEVDNGAERFWVMVNEINGDTIKGEIINCLVIEIDTKLGDIISFKKENIYDIIYK